MPLPPQVIAALFRQASGTLTTRAGLPARTTSPAFRQKRQGRLCVGTTCSRKAGGTKTAPRTTR